MGYLNKEIMGSRIKKNELRDVKENSSITLVIVCDNHLVVMLAALLKSIEKSHLGEEQVNIYVINDKISRRNVSKINQTITSKKVRLIWKTIEQSIPRGVQLPKDRSSYPLCIYVRLFMHQFLPETLEKVIYIDVDTIVLRDIRDLWNTHIDNFVVGAVTDRANVVSCSWNGIKNYNELGLDPQTRYFNTGVLIIDLKRWREMNATKLVMNAVDQNSEFADYPDQYGFNVVFANNSFELDPRWNNFAENANADPFIIHFSGLKPLFKGYNFNLKYKDIFYDLLKETPWTEYSPRSSFRSQTKKILNLVSKSAWDIIGKKAWIAFSQTIRLRAD